MMNHGFCRSTHCNLVVDLKIDLFHLSCYLPFEFAHLKLLASLFFMHEEKRSNKEKVKTTAGFEGPFQESP